MGDSGDDSLSGGAGDDTLIGGAGDDRIFGQDDDALIGGLGADLLDGVAGLRRTAATVLEAGGADRLTGASGRDWFFPTGGQGDRSPCRGDGHRDARGPTPRPCA